MSICFLDRDGVINKDYGYVGTLDRFELFPETIQILKLLSKLEYKLVMITNQSGISRGLYSLSDFYDLSFHLLNVLKHDNIEMEINFCPHKSTDNCLCRKPRTGMIERYKISLNDIFIGDNETDMIAAYRVNIRNRYLISTESSPYATKQFTDHKHLLKYLNEFSNP